MATQLTLELGQEINQIIETRSDLDLAESYHSESIVLLGAIDTLRGIETEYSDSDLSLSDAAAILVESIDEDDDSINAVRKIALCNKDFYEDCIEELQADLISLTRKGTLDLVEEMLCETEEFIDCQESVNEARRGEYLPGEVPLDGQKAIRHYRERHQMLTSIRESLNCQQSLGYPIDLISRMTKDLKIKKWDREDVNAHYPKIGRKIPKDYLRTVKEYEVRLDMLLDIKNVLTANDA